MMNIEEIAALVGAEVVAADQQSLTVQIKKLAPIDRAGAGELSFLANPEYAKYAAATQASALLVASPVNGCRAVQLVHPEPYACFAKVAQRYHVPPRPPAGVAATAVVSPDAKIGARVSIGPYCVIEAGAVIADDCVLYAQVYVGAGVVIGARTVLYPQAVVYYGCKIGADCIIHAGAVIGSDGFGYAVTKEETIKIPQVGIVVIEDDVEIGAVSTVDRAAMGITRVGRGTKLDSRVQIAHNCEVGERCMISAFSGLAGSAKIGDRVTMGGHSGINGHTNVASDCRIGAMTGVTSSLSSAGEYIGFPAAPAMQWRRQQVHLKKLADYEKRIRVLERLLLTDKQPPRG